MADALNTMPGSPSGRPEPATLDAVEPTYSTALHAEKLRVRMDKWSSLFLFKSSRKLRVASKHGACNCQQAIRKCGELDFDRWPSTNYEAPLIAYSQTWC